VLAWSIMKIGIAQLNAVIGDFPGNAKRLLQAYRQCLEAGAELVLTPELSLVGYPPLDLLLRSQFVPKCLQALDYLASEIKDVPLLVGYVDHNSSGKPGKPFRNAAAFMQGGEIRAKIFKTLLPACDAFDERRYFEPADSCTPLEWRGRQLGITIGEDIWTEDHVAPPLYDRDPVRELRAKKIDLLLNLSASPFHLGKPELRRGMLSRIAREAGVPLVYANAVGAHDSLVFDGHSLVLSPAGHVSVQMSGFAEACETVDCHALPDAEAHLPATGNEQLHQALVVGLRDYAAKCGFRSACLGLDGGIDSAVTAVLAAEALGPEHVHALTMPGPLSSPASVEDSLALARRLGIRCDSVPITEVFSAVQSTLATLIPGGRPDNTEQNLQDRLRGLYLMALANKHGHLLLSTGNKSELAVGYCTIHGDMWGGLALISDLPKTRVSKLARWLNHEQEVIPWSIIRNAPGAELRPDQRDRDRLPPDEILDDILELYVERHLSVEEIVEHGFDEITVRWVQRHVDLNEWKRQQAAPGIHVTTRASFGPGRRVPIAQAFG